jgi:TrmH family RNA methyltransferase
MKFDDLKKLHQKKYREEYGHYLVEGEHLVLELQKAAARDERLLAAELYVTHEYGALPGPFTIHVINARHMAQVTETRAPQGVIAVVPSLPPAAPRPGERAVCLHEIQDPGNLGTILRTLAWFGGFRCLLTPGSVDPHNAKVIRAGMGATFHVPVEVDVPLASLPSRYPRIACLDTRGAPVQSPQFAGFDCYLFGNEARGLPDEATSAAGAQPFTIPGGQAIDSLNLAAAVNICVYELNRGPAS